jgi:cell division transport system ATP-binding protein
LKKNLKISQKPKVVSFVKDVDYFYSKLLCKIMSLDTIIEFCNAKICQQDHLVMSNVNFKIDKGEFVYLIGKVGSGKSSLIKTINAELPLTEGTGFVAGFELEKLKTRKIPYLRRKLGVVFQDFQLLTDRTVIQNLVFVLKATGWKDKKEIEKRISDVLEKTGLTTKGYKMPHQLSGGEQQRVSIARALLNDPEIILADEPTGNLDPDTSAGIMNLLFEISHNGRAVIMATHNYTFLKNFPSRIVKCENGTLVETEKSEEIDFETLMN